MSIYYLLALLSILAVATGAQGRLLTAYDYENKDAALVQNTTTRKLQQTTPWWTCRPAVGDNDLMPGCAAYAGFARSANNKKVIADPTGSSANVIKVTYPTGCTTPSSGCGGYQGNIYPYNRDQSISSGYARLEYDVYFPSNFPWNKGGKLFGLEGGTVNDCGGGEYSSDCFSARVMWRKSGYGEVYLYVPSTQSSGFCSTAGTQCYTRNKISFQRGRFQFKAGSWNKVVLTVKLNTIGSLNGWLRLDVNGQRAITWDTMNWRTKAISTHSVVFSAFFGGSSLDYAPPYSTYSLFRNIKVYK